MKVVIVVWKETYGMNEEQVQLLRALYEQKNESPDNLIVLSQQEIKLLDGDNEGLEESRISFEEMGIFWS